MSPRIDLVVVDGPGAPAWGHGRVVDARGSSVADLGRLVEEAVGTGADAVLHWDLGLGQPPPGTPELLDEPDDVWHGGLLLGTAGSPGSIDLVAPTWLLNADPPADRAGTSWRLSLRACLARAQVIVDLGHLDPSFAGRAGAEVELGHRWITGGARCRHDPRVLGEATPTAQDGEVPPADAIRFVRRRYGATWATYAALRAGRPLEAWRQRHEPSRTAATLTPVDAPVPDDGPADVDVIIPTTDRYPWLIEVLAGLGRQTVRPAQVVVADQTGPDRRQAIPAAGDVPVTVITLDRAGQCTARNRALEASTADLVLFLDDDEELPDDLIARHLTRLRADRIDVVRERPRAR